MTRTLRTVSSMAALLAALALDAWLIRRPQPHSVAEFSPFETKLGREELILAKPVSQDGPLLSHQGAQNEAVDIFFERAVLSAQSKRLLHQQPWAQSDDPQTISYTTLDSPGAHGAPCRTFVNLVLENAAASEIRFSQKGVAGGKQHREIELKPSGSSLVVDFQTMADNPALLNQPGCSKLLQVGSGQIALAGIPLQVTAVPGSSVRLKFMPATANPLWKGSKGWYEPFQAINLRAPSVFVSPINSAQTFRKVYTADGQPSIYIDSLLVGSDGFQAGLSGVAMVAIAGNLVGPTLAEWIAASHVRFTIVAILNLLVLCGAVLFVSMGRRLNLNLASGKIPKQTQAPAGRLKVFLCHCSEDKQAVRELNTKLEEDGYDPWLDEEDILPARLWTDEIQQGLHASHAIVVCLSKEFQYKEGFVQKELGYALELAEEKPDRALFLIPVRLEDCGIPARLSSWQCIDLYLPGGYAKLKAVLDERARQLGIARLASKAAGA